MAGRASSGQGHFRPDLAGFAGRFMSASPRKRTRQPLIGADPASLARVQQQISELKQSLPGTIAKTVTQAKKMRAL